MSGMSTSSMSKDNTPVKRTKSPHAGTMILRTGVLGVASPVPSVGAGVTASPSGGKAVGAEVVGMEVGSGVGRGVGSRFPVSMLEVWDGPAMS